MANLCTPKCYVCGNQAAWSDKTGRTTYLCSECAPSRLHTVSMTLEYVDGSVCSVAACQCGGFVNRTLRDGDKWWLAQDAAVRAHWVDVIKAAAGAAA